MMRILPALILQTGLSITAHADATASIEIQSLIQAVLDSNCEFDRNGNLYSAENAAEHLELKYARGKRYADSAEAFIEHLATKSSWSDKPYWMICGGDKAPSADWLLARLEIIRSR